MVPGVGKIFKIRPVCSGFFQFKKKQQHNYLVFLVFDKFSKNQRFKVGLFIYLFRDPHPKGCFFPPKTNLP
jgi:hypothetical protein